jgi:signal transduction histidine kinase
VAERALDDARTLAREAAAANERLMLASLREQELAQEAQAANRAKSEFLSNMSHELRTPLNAVMAYTDLLDLGISGPVTERQKAHLERIKTVTAQAAAGGVEIQVLHCDGEEPCYLGDRQRVRQVLVNLLANAVKFTEPGGRVTVTCGCTQRPDPETEFGEEGRWTYMRVQDTGIGIAPDQLAAVFRPFVQVETGYTRARGGTGLGLAIARDLAVRMGGALTLRSEPGVGSCFTLGCRHAPGQLRPPTPDLRHQSALRPRLNDGGSWGSGCRGASFHGGARNGGSTRSGPCSHNSRASRTNAFAASMASSLRWMASRRRT